MSRLPETSRDLLPKIMAVPLGSVVALLTIGMVMRAIGTDDIALGIALAIGLTVVVTAVGWWVLKVRARAQRSR